MSNIPHLFAALGDPTRFAIVERLLCEGDLSVGDLREGFEISAPAISRHLNVLRDVGLLERRVAKQKRIYSVRPETMQSIGAWVEFHRKFWAGSLDRLERALIQERTKK